MSAEHWDLDQDNTMGGDNPSPNKSPSQKAVNEFVKSQGGGSSVFIAEYGVTTYADILSAYNSGKSIEGKIVYNNIPYNTTVFSYDTSANRFFFQFSKQTLDINAYLSSDDTWAMQNNYVQTKISIIYGV